MIKKLTILEALFSKSWGGLEMLAAEYAEWFAGRGHRVILCSEENPYLHARLAGTPVRLVVVKPLTRYCDLFTAWRLSRIIRQERVDVIHAHISRDLSALLLAKKIAGDVSLVFSQHMDSRYPKKDIFHRWLYAGIDKIITITDSMRENQLRFSPARQEQVMRIYNGIDPERFAPVGGNIDELKEKYRIPLKRRIISMIGRLDRLKNQKLLLKAAHSIIEKHDDAYFLLVGNETPSKDGKGYRSELESEIGQLHLEEYCSILDFQENVEEIIALSDVIVLTTPKESFGLVLVEAMSMEKPVVGANAGGAAEIVRDFETGRLFKPNNEESLADSIIWVLNDAGRRREMGKKGRIDVLKRFNRQINFLQYECEFSSIIGKQAN